MLTSLMSEWFTEHAGAWCWLASGTGVHGSIQILSFCVTSTPSLNGQVIKRLKEHPPHTTHTFFDSSLSVNFNRTPMEQHESPVCERCDQRAPCLPTSVLHRWTAIVQYLLADSLILTQQPRLCNPLMMARHRYHLHAHPRGTQKAGGDVGGKFAMTQKYNNAFLMLSKKSKVATAMLELACKYPRGENFGGYCTAVGLPCHSDWWYNHGPQQWASQQPGNRPPATAMMPVFLINIGCAVSALLETSEQFNASLSRQLCRTDANACLELFAIVGVDVAARLK